MYGPLRILSLLLILFAVIASPAVNAGEVLYARYPALSPDGQTIAFSYRGDIWTVSASGGEATRLTVHEADDIRPRFSPDGKRILFSSRRFNNYDVYVMPSSGGVPKQLTFHSSDDIATAWFPAGDSLVFQSGRDEWRDLFKLSVDGGAAVKLIGSWEEQEYFGSITPDGKQLLFATGTGGSRWYRRDMRTGGNSDIFLLDRTSSEYATTRLTDHPNHDVWPVLNTETSEVYFVSNRGEWAQIWKVPLAGGAPVQVTNFTNDGVQWLNSNPQGTMLVFEQNFRIWTLDPSNSQPQQVNITIATDERDNLVEKKVFNGDVEWYALSPDEKKIVAVIHGEIFVLPAEDPEEARRITNTSAREIFPMWGRDSRTLYYASDRNGNYDIYSADAVTATEKQLTSGPDEDIRPLPSPDGKYLVFQRGLERLVRFDLEKAEETVWVQGPFLDLGIEPALSYDWSPDSKWLAFAMAGATHETDIHVADLQGDIHNISKHIGFNYRPRFSADGKKLYYQRWTRDDQKVFEIDLVHEAPEFFEAAFDSLFVDPKEEDDKNDDKKKGDKKKDKDEKPVDEPVKIDFERIELRRHPAFSLDSPADEPVLTPDGESYVFVSPILGKPEVWAVNTEDKPKLEQLTHSGKAKSYLSATKDSKTVYFIESGKIKTVAVKGGKTEMISFKAAMDIDVIANNRQKFNETWSMLNSYFYDADFHGIDWEAAREKYAPLVEQVRTESEFQTLILEMMGELSASHMYFYSNVKRTPSELITGETGLEFDYGLFDSENVLKIAEVIPESPADLAGITAGAYLRAIDGQAVSRESDFSSLLAGRIGNRVVLTLSDTPEGKTSDIEIKPVSRTPISRGRELRWVQRNRHLVDSLSGGRLAYLYIPSMNMPSLKKFEEELVSIAEAKEGMVLDVRHNGGGWTAVRILGALMRSPYILRAFRGQDPVSENKYRGKAYERPMTLLINNYSGSNAEIFAEGFRKLGLGKIVGTPTGSGVIGTGSYTLIDGTRVRRPSTAAYTTEMENTELVPRRPDFFVELLPEDYLNGRDPQIAKAVEELLKEL